MKNIPFLSRLFHKKKITKPDELSNIGTEFRNTPEPGKLGVGVDPDTLRVEQFDFRSHTIGRVLFGDIITKIDDRDVASVSELQQALADKKPGDSVALGLNRKGEFVSVNIALI